VALLRNAKAWALLTAIVFGSVPLGHADAAPSAPKGATGRSVGSPTEGRLVGGKRLEETSYLRIVPAYAAGNVRWGLPALVNLLDRAAHQVFRLHGGAIASVGHLSREGGGDVQRHHSHESGRDVDVSFYLTNETGKPYLPSRFHTIRKDGRAVSSPNIRFDDAKNWAFIEAILTDPGARVTHVFIVQHLKARLLAYAERTGKPSHVRARAAELLSQPRGALPHDDHFHIRIGCPSKMAGCVEYPTRARDLGAARKKASSRSGHPTWAKAKHSLTRGGGPKHVPASTRVRAPKADLTPDRHQ
jgi:penicillin-insensitive murein endopeptidase